MKVTLSPFEQLTVKALAKARYKRNREEGTANKKIGPQSNEMTDLEGAAAELAFCKIMNVYPDLTIDGGRPEEDAILIDGTKVDVKATKYEDGRLLVSTKKRSMPTDVYVLMVGTFPTYRVAGHMSKDMLFQNQRLKNFGHGFGYAAEQEELDKFGFTELK